MKRVVIAAQRRITLTGLVMFLCTMLAMVWVLQWSDATRKVDRLLHDNWVRASQRAVPEDVVIVAIDSRSLAKLGRWPWSRELQARLVEQLQLQGVKAGVLDLLYVEPSDLPEQDARLARAIASLPVSILPVLTEGGRGSAASELVPTPSILRHVTDLGHVFLPIDDDGIVRRQYLKAGINHSHWPSLSLAALGALGEAPEPLPGLLREAQGIEGEWVENNEILIPFYGPNGTFRRVSAVDLIEGNLPNGQLKDKVVFVGMTTTGLGDVVPTPVSALNQSMPGVEIHANVFAALRDESTVVQINGYLNMLVALILLPALLYSYSRATPRWALLGAVMGVGLPILLSFLLYVYARLWYAPLSAALPLLGSYLLWSWHRLEYVNRFLARERGKLEPFMPAVNAENNEPLASFFRSAERHLPIQGWRISAGGQMFMGGTGLPDTRIVGMQGRWNAVDGVHSRQYPGKRSLNIEIVFNDSQYRHGIMQFVNNLARVRARGDVTRLSGSIERLQSNALKLSEQMEWLRSVKIFADTVLDGSPVGFAVWSAAGECLRSSRLLYSSVPAFQERAQFVDFLACIGEPLTSREGRERFDKLILEREPWQIIYSADERELVINFSAVGDTLADRLICVSVLDVTDIRSAERARSEMVDYLSHDLRSPLISALYLLEPNSDPRVEQNIKTSLAMMDDLLHVARADSLSEVKFTSVYFNGVLDNSLDQMLPQALNKRIQFDIESDEEVDLWVKGDAASLERAIANILSNAIKYSPEDTTVRVRLFQEGEQAVLIIEDQGVGIDPDMLGQLFTRFRRDAKIATQFKGIGLGLALVTRVVSLHNGKVAASNTDEGTRITLELPLEVEAPEAE
ncbi:CHASE2 domain-containing protein [Granulosicoccus antarcticus]|uniref:histidine kinase n=1 Tax=Granulosicoccus antarcticus IMCC3135 TaxID=1192854 RepID=A0A2Z2NXJ0_9GAMM|nr:CHASE2 domain-containing protein [Granulosicoccus antarcticus]ASJ75983.1 Alginate biosynthesis sensor protein KinB [Granulosicoccus antarcticus IMCC3135]